MSKMFDRDEAWANGPFTTTEPPQPPKSEHEHIYMERNSGRYSCATCGVDLGPIHPTEADIEISSLKAKLMSCEAANERLTSALEWVDKNICKSGSGSLRACMKEHGATDVVEKALQANKEQGL